MSRLTITLWVVLIILIIWMIWNYFRVRRAAKFVDVTEFSKHLHTGQLIDVRDPAQFQKKHILGARNFSVAQFDQSLSALRKDKAVLIYDSMRGGLLPRCIMSLKKAGFTEVYVLKDGFESWTGKTKS